MTEITRRKFLTSTALSIAASHLHAQSQSGPLVTLAIPTQANGPQMPMDFVGLSYEVQQLTDPAFFSPHNSGLIEQCKALSPSGVLRLGGNTSEFGWWQPTPDTPEPKHPKTREVEGEPKAEYYPVTPEAVRSLAGFLKATGWSCLYGIGMGTNTPERAADEAGFVAEALGSSLQYFQIGNEADLFSHHLRDPNTWNAKAYLEEWLILARAVAARVPGARFGLPDVAANQSWLTEIADLWPSVKNPPTVVRLSHHYYFGGPATNPEVSIANLLKPETMQKVRRTAEEATAAAKKMGVRVRMTEGNTCYRGGKPGVSDVFAAAIWAADYALLLASHGYSGVNLHGGTGKSVANSVGGFLPGDVMLKQQGQTEEQIAARPHPFYTPIGTFGSKYELEPVAYGLKFASRFCGATLFNTDFTAKLQESGVDATAYAAKLANGKPSVILINKDGARDVEVTIDFGGGQTGFVESEMLHAPRLESREAHIARSNQRGHLKAGRFDAIVPRGTVVRFTLERFPG